MDNTQEEVKVEYHRLLFSVRRSILYHSARYGFWLVLEKTTLVLILISGLGAIYVAFVDNLNLGMPIIIIILAISITDRVINSKAKIVLYNELVKSFIQLEQEMILGDEPSIKNIKSLQSGRLTIETKEPNKLCVLDCLMHN
jgi:hypothetical protein